MRACWGFSARKRCRCRLSGRTNAVQSEMRVLVSQVELVRMCLHVLGQKTAIFIEGVCSNQIFGMDSSRVLPKLRVRAVLVVAGRRSPGIQRKGASAVINEDVFRFRRSANFITKRIEFGKTGALANGAEVGRAIGLNHGNREQQQKRTGRSCGVAWAKTGTEFT